MSRLVSEGFDLLELHEVRVDRKFTVSERHGALRMRIRTLRRVTRICQPTRERLATMINLT